MPKGIKVKQNKLNDVKPPPGHDPVCEIPEDITAIYYNVAKQLTNDLDLYNTLNVTIVI